MKVYTKQLEDGKYETRCVFRKKEYVSVKPTFRESKQDIMTQLMKTGANTLSFDFVDMYNTHNTLTNKNQ